MFLRNRVSRSRNPGHHPLLCFAALGFLLASIPSCHALGTGKPLREYGRQSWQSDSGLPQNTVHAVAQTGDGYLWAATEAGLVRYDGADFRVFDPSNTPALRNSFISDLKEDAAGSLWISTPGGLVRERAGRFTSYGTAEGLPSSVVLACYVTHEGRLLALTPGGVAAFDKGRFTLLKGTERLALTDTAGMAAEDAQGRVWIAGPESVVSLARDSGRAESLDAVPEIGEFQALAVTDGGELWVGGADGVAVLGKGRPRRLTVREGLPSNEVTSLLASPQGDVWIGSNKGLALYSHGVIKAQPELGKTPVRNLFLDRAGALWVATTAGLARITHGAVDRMKRGPALTGVLSIFEDREGSMWFGTDTAGLQVMREQAFSTITTEDGLSAGLVRAVFQDHAGTVWIGTSGGGLDRVTGGNVTTFKGKLPSDIVLALAETGDHLWVGTPEGLARVRNGQCRVFTTADGLADDFVRSLYADSDGSLWIGTRDGLSHLKDGAFHSYSKLDGLGSDLIGAILRGRDGTLWIGTLDGLSRMQGDGFVNVPPRASAGGNAVTTLLEDSEGTLWVGTNGSGLGLLRKNAPKNAPITFPFAGTGLPATIYGMLEDASGNLWLSSRKGVDRVSIAALNTFAAFAGRRANNLPITSYGAADGMRISEASGGGHPAAWRAQDGALWFATPDGAAVVHPQAVVRNTVPPPTAIEEVLIDDRVDDRVDDRSIDPEKKTAVPVPSGRGRFTIHYAGLSFVAPQKVRYRYMLKGFDKTWVFAGGRRTAFYTNVPPGSYRFVVLSANNDGVWSTAPAAVDFTVRPYFYQTKWFYALAAIGLAGFGYLIYRWRVLTVEAQYQAVLRERGRIAREIHDTLAQGYVAISVQLEVAERMLASSTEAAVQQIKQTKELARESLAEARSSIWNLRAQSDAETLPSQLAAMSLRHAGEGPTVKFAVRGAYRPLGRTVESEVRRIAQEAVANAVAHARATLVSVTLSYDAQLLELRVDDDGIGLTPNAKDYARHGHFGLQGMAERAARIDARLEIEGGNRAGTCVTLQVDLRRAQRGEQG